MRRWWAVLAVALALAGVLACGGQRQQPGETRCVDDRGRATPCPDRWR